MACHEDICHGSKKCHIRWISFSIELIKKSKKNEERTLKENKMKERIKREKTDNLEDWRTGRVWMLKLSVQN